MGSSNTPARQAACVGSINIDDVYTVPHIVLSGETIASVRHDMHAGGKGANQSVAMARAKVPTFHVGAAGDDGKWVLEEMEASGVDVSLVETGHGQPTGRAIIQVSEATHDNAIVLLGGANHTVNADTVSKGLKSVLNAGDFVVLQNEINFSAANTIIEEAVGQGLFVVVNPAPCPSNILTLLPNLNLAHAIVVNESEAFAIFQLLESSQATFTAEREISERFKQGKLQGKDLVDFAKQIASLILGTFTNTIIVCITLGGEGSVLAVRSADSSAVSTSVKVNVIEAMKHVKIVDTTGAGDTYVGYFVAGLLKQADKFISAPGGKLTIRDSYTDPETNEVSTLDAIAVECAKLASVAGGLACETKGAVPGIPYFDDVVARHEHGHIWRMFHKTKSAN